MISTDEIRRLSLNTQVYMLFNLLYSTRDVDPITGSVPYKAYLCKIGKIAE